MSSDLWYLVWIAIFNTFSLEPSMWRMGRFPSVLNSVQDYAASLDVNLRYRIMMSARTDNSTARQYNALHPYAEP